jgi:hypothetical protein
VGACQYGQLPIASFNLSGYEKIGILHYRLRGCITHLLTDKAKGKKMGTSQSQLLQKFLDGKTEGNVSNMFIKDAALYSFGSHFPMLVKMPQWGKEKTILNADRYSSTTARHQRLCFKSATIQIPFSALFPALKRDLKRDSSNQRGPYPLKMLEGLKLINIAEERWDLRGYYRFDSSGKKQFLSILKFESLLDKSTWLEDQERRPQSCVLSFEKRCLLSSMDRNNYFISELPEMVRTVDEAFLTMLPVDVLGTGYQRQGEWFFVPTSIKGIPKKYIQKHCLLPNRHPNHKNLHHEARDYVEPFTGIKHILVRGGIRHLNRDHRTLYLGEQWHYAIEASQLVSWGANGRVD